VHTGEVAVGVGVGRASERDRARRGAAGCLYSGFASHCEDGDGLAGLHWFGWAASSQLGRAGVGDGCWVGLGFRPGFRPQLMLILKIPFLFPNLFIICKLI
jgi:hypothetical protein